MVLEIVKVSALFSGFFWKEVESIYDFEKILNCPLLQTRIIC